ncbi:MAG: DUF2333 family protein [Thermodesulfobacteriota bacterium]
MMKMLDRKQGEAEKGNFAVFFWVRVVAGLVVAVAVIWITATVLNFVGRIGTGHEGQATASGDSHGKTAEASHPATDLHPGQAEEPVEEESGHRSAESAESPAADDEGVSTHETERPATVAKTAGHGVAVHGAAAVSEKTAEMPRVKGVAFLDAMIKPMELELKKRAWGWRPNDIIEFTDNVNNFQLGVLEATRRASTRLAERISRTGTTNTLDENLERAMNDFMIAPDSFMLPSAESKYGEGLKELRAYQARLLSGEADFYTRADNLIPLLVAFADLLGSCDDNLVKATEKNGQPVSTFAADNYFYYAKGVASTILPILEAVAEDFEETLTTRRATDVLLHAIHACHEASGIEPLVVLESDLDSIFANHRTNMAAHISHARFYLDVLAATLST